MEIDSLLEKALLKILKQIDAKPIIPIECQLWDEHDIANYFKYSLDYTKRNIITNKNFPPSRQLPTDPNSKRSASRWKATDVINYGLAFDKRHIH